MAASTPLSTRSRLSKAAYLGPSKEMNISRSVLHEPVGKGDSALVGLVDEEIGQVSSANTKNKSFSKSLKPCDSNVFCTLYYAPLLCSSFCNHDSCCAKR